MRVALFLFSIFSFFLFSSIEIRYQVSLSAAHMAARVVTAGRGNTRDISVSARRVNTQSVRVPGYHGADDVVTVYMGTPAGGQDVRTLTPVGRANAGAAELCGS